MLAGLCFFNARIHNVIHIASADFHHACQKKICFYIKNLPTCMLLLRGDDFNIKKYHLQSTLEVVLLEIDTLERRQNRRAKYRAP